MPLIRMNGEAFIKYKNTPHPLPGYRSSPRFSNQNVILNYHNLVLLH